MNAKREFTPAEQALIDKHRDINVDYHDWHDYTLDNFVEECNAIGLDVDRNNIQYSGFWSQGDGASFTFKSDSLSTMVEKSIGWLEANPAPEDGKESRVRKELRSTAEWLVATFERFRLGGDGVWENVLGNIHIEAERVSHHYSHSRTVRAGWSYEYADEDDLVKYGLLGKERTTHGPDAALLDNEQIDGYIEDLANALYRDLEEEHEYQTSDEQVWEALVANDLVPNTETEEDNALPPQRAA